MGRVWDRDPVHGYQEVEPKRYEHLGLIPHDAPANYGRPLEPAEPPREPPPWLTPAMQREREQLELVGRYWPAQADELRRRLPRVEIFCSEPGGPVAAYRLRYPPAPAQPRPGFLARLFPPRQAESPGWFW